MQTDTTILYFADPMCSWCWGFAPSLLALQKVAPGIPLRLVLGGLAPDSKAPMEDSMQAYIQQAWREVSAQCGVDFNFDFWKICTPRRTYPRHPATGIFGCHGIGANAACTGGRFPIAT